MALKLNAPGGAVETIPANDYIGALVAMIELGTQEHTYQGKASLRPDVMLVFELDGKCYDHDNNEIESIRSDGSRHLIADTFTASLDPRGNLLKIIQHAVGKIDPKDGFNLPDLMGTSYSIRVDNRTDGKNTYHEIAKDGITSLHRSDKPIPHDKQREHYLYELEQGAVDHPDWIPKSYGKTVAQIIALSQEMGGKTAEAAKPDEAKPAKEPEKKPNKREALMQADLMAAKALATTKEDTPARLQAQTDVEHFCDKHGIKSPDFTPDLTSLLIPF